MRWASIAATFVAVALIAACGGGHGPSASPPPYVLEAGGGTYNDGSGVLGVSALATLRDAAGAGPSSPWTGTLDDASGIRASLTYADPSSGSYAALWWHDVAFAAGSYGLALGSGTDTASTSFSIADAPPLAPPLVTMSSDGTTLSWSSVAGAASLECRIATSTGPVSSAAGALSSCAVGGLPDGSYSASILAYSADPATLATDLTQRPSLPARFDVSEGRLAFLRSGSAPVVILAAAGGAIDYGLGQQTLATWMSIVNADGTASTETWAISITGPGIPGASPITFTHPANFSRLLVWSYDQPATPGLYALTASSAAGTLTTEFSVGAPATLDIPSGITASGTGAGAATVSWPSVTGARSYLVSAWQGASFVTSQWVASSPASFPNGTFTSGQLYDVYVAATDADMVGGVRPTQVAVAENTLQPAGLAVP